MKLPVLRKQQVDKRLGLQNGWKLDLNILPVNIMDTSRVIGEEQSRDFLSACLLSFSTPSEQPNKQVKTQT